MLRPSLIVSLLVAVYVCPRTFHTGASAQDVELTPLDLDHVDVASETDLFADLADDRFRREAGEADDDANWEDEVVDNIEDVADHARSRRAIVSDLSLRWPKGIIPYVLTDAIDDKHLREIKRGMATYERFTCLRFVPWTNTTNQDLGLDHDGHLRFESSTSCRAELGNKRRKSGQYISCCDAAQCVHELGHAIGFIHEHQSPDRDGWIRVNEENVLPDSRRWFLEYDEADVISEGYDLQSVMMYPPASLRIPNKGYSVTILYPELTYGYNFFYLLRQTAHAYQCAENHCKDFPLTCHNDGFLTLVEGQCACYCPEGLDPATGCADIMKKVPEGTEFPGGKWALPMTTSGCPDGSFEVGYRKHYTDSDGPNLESDPYHLNGTISDRWAEHYFCVNSGGVGNNETYWPDGNYCIYPVGGECPSNRPGSTEGTEFKTGHIDFANIVNFRDYGEQSGVLPDGLFNEKKTHFNYCCKVTGFERFPLYLPTSKPLVLFQPRLSFSCQKVFGMHASHEWVALNSLNFQSATHYGETPYSKATRNMRRMYIKHCYYEPSNTDCGFNIQLNTSHPSYSFSYGPGDLLDCNWYISAPQGSQIKLDLDQMNVTCDQDFVSVRAVRLGQSGQKFCGSKVGQSIISHYNTMMMQFYTLQGSQSSFRATFTLVKDSDLCYNTEDLGASYAGDVYYTRSFVQCLNWTDVTHCPFHAFKSDGIGKNLDMNYCRNPGNGFQPWCYTSVTECARDYCDVCETGSRYDTADNCQQLQEAGNCTSDPLALHKCAMTCKNELPFVPTTQNASSVTCPFPPPLPDGTLTLTGKTSYQVGEKVTYKCKDENSNSTVDRTCQSDGLWSPALFACFECDQGWTLFQGRCYKHYDEPHKYPEAESTCAEHGAYLAIARDEVTNNFLGTLRHFDLGAYLGAQSQQLKDDWFWADGSNLTWTNWRTGFPSLKNGIWRCLKLQPDGQWTDRACRFHLERFICEKNSYDIQNRPCADSLATCKQLLAAQPDMCKNFSDFSARSCARSCDLCNGSAGCELTDPTENAEFVHKSYQRRERVPEGTELFFACKGDMVRKSGDAVRICREGLLSGADLVCQDKTALVKCKLDRPNSLVTILGTEDWNSITLAFGKWARYQCQSGSQRVKGDYWRKCSEDGTLGGEPLVCEKKPTSLAKCQVARPRRPVLALRPRNGGVLEEGKKATFWCQPGYTRKSGDSSRTCLSSGKLSGQPLTCKRRNRG
ncbi:uncharacterized protein LOC101848513 [Aplysia californica]|uniref:Metalloendopeptidase n=1 Tax=Aplysia californica TaxID=6500 RepID=A0ABM0ZXU9_APLCA|nr:uncharacterized protein LOC101848513 [Aplysia californica]